MNVKEYISSGIVESYVMGLVSDTERQEFETLCAQYPEIIAARNAFELSMEEKLLSDAKQPPQHLKQLIEARILGNDSENEHVRNREHTPVRHIGVWKWLAAASLILFVVTGFWALNRHQENEKLSAANLDLQNQLNTSTTQLSRLKQETDMLQQPGLKMAALKGTAHAPEALVTVYWDTASTKDVYLMINNMPQPPSDKQYQLWAMMNGKPINLGVFDMRVKQDRLLVKMQNVQNAQAFAITLEPSGGSVNPTMDSMYAIGSL